MTLIAEEQFMLELINRARLDPLGEAARYGLADLNEGLAVGTITATVKEALAPNDLLDNAATDHTLWMFANDTFSHIGVGGSNAEDRIRAAGYAVSGFWWGENLGQYMTTGTIPDLATVTAGIHQALFLSAGHRANILRDVFREVGIGLETGVFNNGGTNYNAALVTQNYAQYGTDVFLTGVAFNDTDNDNFYSVGEAVANVTFSIGAASTQTAAAGGYALKIAPGANQTVTVTPSGGSASTVVVDLSAGNVKLDLVGGTLLRSSGHLTLVSGVANAELLGAGNLNLTGNDVANRLTGNSGNNVIRAGLGNDVVIAGLGNDYVFDHGGNDLVNLGDGNDYIMVGG
ncbi:MAG: CAP domain-containing protein, partial [Albidovulum sp.]